MQIRSVVVVAALGLASSALAQQAVQWRVEDGGNGHWYLGSRYLGGQELDWFDAVADAESRGGHLATPVTQSENDWIRQNVLPQLSLANGEFGPWLGGIYQAGQWSWITGEKWVFSGWGGIEPSNPADETRLHYWRASCCLWWNDTSPVSEYGSSIIEWSADCNGDGIVDYGQCRDGSLADYNGNNVPDCCEAGIPCTVGNYPVQWRTEDGGNGHWYLAKRWEGTKSWESAKVSVEQLGGYLACITSAAENAWIFQHCDLAQPGCGLSQEGWHLGGFQDLGAPDYSEPAGGWRWISGEPWVYTAWLTNVPGGDRPNNFGPGGEQYLKMSELPYAPWWDDVGIGSSQQFMCGAIIEWSADCNGDGIVDYGQILDATFEDAHQNGVPDICEIDPCPGDVNESGVVNAVDISMILSSWGTNGGKFPRTDTNQDGIVDAQDLAVVLGGWGNCP